MKAFGFALLGLLICGCSSSKPTPSRALPPLPGNYVPPTGRLQRVEKLSEASPARLVIEWDNQPSDFSSNYLTGIEASSDLAHWRTVAEIPYQPRCSVTLNDPQPPLFFRAFNRIKP